ncbi:MAG: hypothetical protein ACI80S_001230 [Pseudohongiellaceae bacterium]|jgi:hypothetical protein
MSNQIEQQKKGDSVADAIAAVVFICIFVAVCIFWVSAQ